MSSSENGNKCISNDDGNESSRSTFITLDPAIRCPLLAIHDLFDGDDFTDDEANSDPNYTSYLVKDLNSIIISGYQAALHMLDDDGMTLLHLVAEEHGMSTAFKVVLQVHQNFRVEHCFGLLRRNKHGETPMQFMAYDEIGYNEFMEYIMDQFPHLLHNRDFASEVFLNLMLHFGENTDEFAHRLRDLLRKYPIALDPQLQTMKTVMMECESPSSSTSSSSIVSNDSHDHDASTQAVAAYAHKVEPSAEEQDSAILLHRYCDGNIGGPDAKILAVLIEEGKQRPALVNGGLTSADILNCSPLHKILQCHIPNSLNIPDAWDCVDTCVARIGFTPVYCAAITFFPMKFTTIGTSQLDTCKVISERYQHFFEHLSNDDLLQLYEAFAAVCSLPFCGKLDSVYYGRLFEACALKGQMHRINCDNENILYTAIRDNLEWWKGLRYIYQESGEAIMEKSNDYELPAPLFAATVGSNVDTIYELFRGDVGQLFGGV
jgi:hypothetical protein